MPFQPTHCSRWDYGYALLKEAGIYDSAGKPVKQREVIIFLLSVFYQFWFSIVKFGKIRYMFSLVWPASTWKLVRSTRSRWSWLQRRCFFLFLFCFTRRWELAADISSVKVSSQFAGQPLWFAAKVPWDQTLGELHCCWLQSPRGFPGLEN